MNTTNLIQKENSQVHQQVLNANKGYVETFGEKANLPLPPGRKFAVLTCMDARLDPAKYAGLAEGDAHVIRNAGGRASDDAIRSLSGLLFTIRIAEWNILRMILFVTFSLKALPPQALMTKAGIMLQRKAVLQKRSIFLF